MQQNWFHAEESLVIDAPPADIYAVVSDYHVGHPAILPAQFGSLTVEQGGKGAGTFLRGSVTVMGRTIPFHHQVTEPEPGRVLVEADIDTGQHTTFTFAPLDGGQRTQVTIASEFPRSPGLMGFIEQLTTPLVVRDMYRQELRRLADYVRGKSEVAAS